MRLLATIEVWNMWLRGRYLQLNRTLDNERHIGCLAVYNMTFKKLFQAQYKNATEKKIIEIQSFALSCFHLR